MQNRRTAYELSASQVSTPRHVIDFFWKVIEERRPTLARVLDLGADDCRFGTGGHFRHYTGVEIDPKRVRVATPPKNGRIIGNCAFRHRDRRYDACIGNPPYVRHHEIDSPWKEDTVARLERQLGLVLNKHCNLYLYFLCLAMLKTHDAGLISLVIPYEWVSRPSAQAIRAYIDSQQWSVAIYRFQRPIFDGVLTTASISIIDKASRKGGWEYFDVTEDCKITARTGITGCSDAVLQYAPRGVAWALRGLSPGSQKIFTLTEGERIHNGLSRRDVVPCVTSLRNVPRCLRTFTHATFKRHFVNAGEKCWLVRSFSPRRSAALNAYLAKICISARDNYTCNNQKPWFNFRLHPIPRLLVGSGFTTFGPKVLVNSIGAHAVGSVSGIHASVKLDARRLCEHLVTIDFEKRVVAHAKTLKKVEIKQLNFVLNGFTREEEGCPTKS